MRALTAAFLVLAIAQNSFAWNGTGHKIVAFIAFSQLTPKARNTSARLLAMHPMLDDMADEDERGRRSVFIRFATWADFIRNDDHFVDTPQKNAQCNASGQPQTSGPAFPGFPDMERHQDWHFVNTPFSSDGTPTGQKCQPNAQTQIEALRRTLAGANVRDDVKAFALPWVLHLVGDVHQPLHATSRFSAALPGGDRGGNSVKLRVGSNLHSFWDATLGTGETDEFIAQVATSIMDDFPSSAAALNLTPGTWIAESFQIAKSRVYTFSGSGTRGNTVTLSADYKKAAKETARERAALAGYRLAAVLNQAFR